MPAPRRVPMTLTTFAITRRVLGRRMLLVPDAELTRIVIYFLAHYAARFGVQVHQVVVMSNHIHLIISAAKQRASAFLSLFFGQVAKAVKALRGLGRGPVWEPGGLGMVELRTADASGEGAAYVVVNPVAAGLIWEPEEWPGLHVPVSAMGLGELRAARPTQYLDPKSRAKWPEEASIALTLPPMLAHLGVARVQELVAREVEVQLAEARADIKRKGHRVMGRRAVLAQSPYKRAKTFEPFGKLNPAFAVGSGNHDARMEAIVELQTFRAEYREAWRRYRAGELEVVFPYGTMKIRQLHGVRVAPDPRPPSVLLAA